MSCFGSLLLVVPKIIDLRATLSYIQRPEPYDGRVGVTDRSIGRFETTGSKY